MSRRRGTAESREASPDGSMAELLTIVKRLDRSSNEHSAKMDTVATRVEGLQDAMKILLQSNTDLSHKVERTQEQQRAFESHMDYLMYCFERCMFRMSGDLKRLVESGKVDKEQLPGALQQFLKDNNSGIVIVNVRATNARTETSSENKFVLRFEAQGLDNAKKLWRLKSTFKALDILLQQDLTPYRMANKKKVLSSPAFKQAVAVELKKGKDKRIFWDLDQCVVNRTRFSAAYCEQQDKKDPVAVDVTGEEGASRG